MRYRDDGSVANELGPSYPIPRDRPAPALPVVAENYHRFDSTNGEVAVADAIATIIEFSGEPELIRITCRTNGAVVTLTDANGIEDRPAVILPNTTQDFRIPRRLVRARNLVPGSNAAISVSAFFARLREPFHG
jgi:hypothetical protein